MHHHRRTIYAVAAIADADHRTVKKELSSPGSVSGETGRRIRQAVAQAHVSNLRIRVPIAYQNDEDGESRYLAACDELLAAHPDGEYIARVRIPLPGGGVAEIGDEVRAEQLQTVDAPGWRTLERLVDECRVLRRSDF